MLSRRALLNGMVQIGGGLALAPARAAPLDLPGIPAAWLRRPDPGLVEVDLDARPEALAPGGQGAELWTYGGTFPGRLLRAREGETLRIHFVNHLPETTNLHFHGLHIPPTGRADNIWLRIPPGERFTYEFTIPHGEGGTYWYHPHPHGRIARQLWAGLAGPLVIESPLDRMPELAAADERTLVLKDLDISAGRPTPHRSNDWGMGKEGGLVLVNGAIAPTLSATAGMVRLRLINAANARYFRLALEDGRPLHLIATDGHFIEQPVALDELLLVPGERADVLVQLEPDRPLRLRQLFYDRRTPQRTRERTLLTLTPPSRMRLLPLPERLTGLPHLRPEDAAMRRRVTMAMFLLDGKPYNPGRVDITGRRGDLELWEVENVGTMDHPFHIHTWYFQVVSRNGRPEPFRAWRDMVNLRPGDRVELLVPLRDYTGRTVYHCHVAEHGDKGMMAVLEVEDERAT